MYQKNKYVYAGGRMGKYFLLQDTHHFGGTGNWDEVEAFEAAASSDTSTATSTTTLTALSGRFQM